MLETLVRRRQRRGFFQGTEVRYRFHTSIEIRRTADDAASTARWCRRCNLHPDTVRETTSIKVDAIIDYVGIGQLVAIQTHGFRSLLADQR